MHNNADEKSSLMNLLMIRRISVSLRIVNLTRYCTQRMYSLHSVDALEMLVKMDEGNQEDEKSILRKVNIQCRWVCVCMPCSSVLGIRYSY